MEEEKKTKIKKVAEEILQTEKSYVDRLKLLNYDFMNFFISKSKACQEKNYPTVKQIETMFLNLGPILNFHMILLSEIEQAIKKWDEEQKIGEIFKTMAPFIKLYGIYMSGYNSTRESLNSYCRKFPKFASDLETQQKLPQCQSLTMLHHMLEPIQRVPRYKMLLAEYHKYLPQNHPDYNACSSSLEMVEKSAYHANNSIREHEATIKLVEIKENLTCDVELVTPGRKFITQGELMREGKKSDKLKPCHLLLFSDILIDCTANSKKLKQHVLYYNNELNLADHQDSNEFKFYLINKNNCKTTYVVKSSEDKTEWLSSIEMAIDDCKSNFQSLYVGKKSVSENLLNSITNNVSSLTKDQNTLSLKTWEKSQKSIIPVCDGVVDVQIHPDKVQSNCFVVLSMKKELFIYDDKKKSHLLGNYDTKDATLYGCVFVQNSSNYCLKIEKDGLYKISLISSKKAVVEKWINCLKRSGISYFMK